MRAVTHSRQARTTQLAFDLTEKRYIKETGLEQRIAAHRRAGRQ